MTDDDREREAARLNRAAEVARWQQIEPRIRLAVQPTSEIAACSVLAQRFANMIEEPVLFEFNGIECIAVPAGDSELLARRQQEAQRRKPRVWSE